MLNQKTPSLEEITVEKKAQDAQWDEIEHALESIDASIRIYLPEEVLEELDGAFHPHDPMLFVQPSYAIQA